ncbi:MAG: hypothetical protein MI861_17310, partial [Pirellulales bacterium]|nr:hypothetical protein [Pirellulales bacterium]
VATGASCVDAKTEQLLVEHVAGINTRLISASMDVREFWHRYRGEIADHDDHGRACAAALLAAGCSEFQIEQTSKAISSLLSDCRIAFQHRFPKLAEQLQLRARPLQERWETFGPGLLGDVQKQIWRDAPPSNWWPSRAKGLLIQPIRGGDGGVLPETNKFWIEAVLTDVDPMVTEVLRVAWLVTRLAVASHFNEIDGGPNLVSAWTLASVALVLQAGLELELVRTTDLPIVNAVRHWRLSDEAVGEKLHAWWQQTRQAQTPLPMALQELERSLQPERMVHLDGDLDS